MTNENKQDIIVIGCLLLVVGTVLAAFRIGQLHPDARQFLPVAKVVDK